MWQTINIMLQSIKYHDDKNVQKLDGLEGNNRPLDLLKDTYEEENSEEFLP